TAKRSCDIGARRTCVPFNTSTGSLGVPSRLEELENTNNLRFLRKRYTDPMNVDRETGKEKDFKLMHQADISLNNGPVLGQTPGQSGLPGQGQGGFGGTQGGLSGLQGALGGVGTQTGG